MTRRLFLLTSLSAISHFFISSESLFHPKRAADAKTIFIKPTDQATQITFEYQGSNRNLRKFLASTNKSPDPRTQAVFQWKASSSLEHTSHFSDGKYTTQYSFETNQAFNQFFSMLKSKDNRIGSLRKKFDISLDIYVS